PARTFLVHATGVAEFAFALLLLWRPSPALGWVLVAFFLALLPANIYSALHHVGLGGHGPAYLWFRVPLQLFFIAWAAQVTGAASLLRSPAAHDSKEKPRNALGAAGLLGRPQRDSNPPEYLNGGQHIEQRHESRRSPIAAVSPQSR